MDWNSEVTGHLPVDVSPEEEVGGPTVSRPPVSEEEEYGTPVEEETDEDSGKEEVEGSVGQEGQIQIREVPPVVKSLEETPVPLR